MARTALCALALVALTGCSLLLDFDKEGLRCDATGQCLEGYVCDLTETCVPEGSPSASCDPACPAFSQCVKGQCEPVCTGRACSAGETCDADTGSCKAQIRSGRLGTGCDADSECEGSGAGAFCMLPYGAGTGSSGVCTRRCAVASDCGTGTLECRDLTSTRSNSKLCVDKAFQGCVKEADCHASGLSCGLFAVSAPPHDVVSACRNRITQDPAGIGETCNASSKPCANGLCVRTGLGSVCTTPCGVHADCQATYPPEQQADVKCLAVTMAFGTLPRLRPLVCVPGGVSEHLPCADQASCHLDAPYCTTFAADPSQPKCASPCAEGATTSPTSCPAQGVCTLPANYTPATSFSLCDEKP